MTTSSASEGPDLRALATRLGVGVAKRRRLLIVFTALAAALALLIAPRLPRSYESEAVLQLRKSLTTATSENAGLQPAETDGKITEDYREVQTELLQSELLHRAVAERLLARGEQVEPGVREQLSRWISSLRREVAAVSREQMLDNLTASIADATRVQRPLKSPIVALRHESPDPRRAQEVLEVLLEEYERCLHGLYDVAAPLAAAREQARTAQEAYELELAAFERFQVENALFDPASQLEAANAELVELGKLLAQRSSETRAAHERAQSMENSLAQMAPQFESQPTRIENKSRTTLLNLLESARRKLIESPFAEGAPEYALLLEPVAALERELAAEPALVVAPNPPAPNTGYLHFQSLLGEARAAAPAAAAALDAIEARMAEQNARMERIGALRAEFERRRDALAQLRVVLDQRREQEQRIASVQAMNEAGQLWSLRVIQAPTLPVRPKSVGWKLLFVLLSLAGALAGLAAVALLGWIDPKVSSAVEVRACVGEQPVLALPDYTGRRELREVLRRIGRSEAPPAAARDDGPRLYSSLGAAARFFESRLDQLVASLLEQAGPQRGSLMFAVCGAHAGAGASTLAANLALRLARRAEGRVLLVRVDPALSGPRVDGALPGVDGHDLANGAADSLEQLARGYAFVVVDGAPVLESDRALEFYRNCDACLLVARCDVTDKAVLNEAAQALLAVVRGRVGVVLNGLRFHLPPTLLAS